MPIKSAQEKINDLRSFIPNARKALSQFEELLRRMETDESFRTLWDSNPGEALRSVGIDPDSRTEMGHGRYDEEGAQCNNCITPNGNACHC